MSSGTADTCGEDLMHVFLCKRSGISLFPRAVEKITIILRRIHNKNKHGNKSVNSRCRYRQTQLAQHHSRPSRSGGGGKKEAAWTDVAERALGCTKIVTSERWSEKVGKHVENEL